jgi:hypothetical protein
MRRPIVEETGDLLALPLLDDTGRPIAFGHGNNMLGGMVGGIAHTLAQAFPGLREAYADYLADTPQLGHVHRWQSPVDGRIILNLVTQVSPGSDARLGAIYPAVTAALAECHYRGVGTLALPRIAAGIGGLEWTAVLAEIARAYFDSPYDVTLRIVQYDAPRWGAGKYVDTTPFPAFDWGDDEPLMPYDTRLDDPLPQWAPPPRGIDPLLDACETAICACGHEVLEHDLRCENDGDGDCGCERSQVAALLASGAVEVTVR